MGRQTYPTYVFIGTIGKELLTLKPKAPAYIGRIDGGRFDPAAALTREQTAAMLSRLAETAGKPLAPTLSSWAFDAVGQMQASGITGSMDNSPFAPQDSYSRKQSIITMLCLYEAVK